jgi:Na+/citrate or Na+/malate symporter
MFVVDLTNPLTLFLVLAVIILLVFLGQELKKSAVAVLPLIFSLGLLILHTVQRITLTEEYMDLASSILISIAIDFILVLVTFFAYLWVDDVEAKAMNKKSIDNSLDWFWKDV